MNILMLTAPSASYGELLQELEHARHLVHTVATPQDALETIARDPPDIAIVSREVAGDKFGAILAAIVGADTLYRSLITLLSDDTPKARLEIYEAGADDIAGPSVTARELASRVRSVERIVRLERRLRERVHELESALHRLEMHANRRGQTLAQPNAKPADKPSEARLPFLLTRTWSGVEELLAKMCSDYLQAPYQIVAGMDLPPPGSPGTQVALSDVEHDLRADISFFAPPESATAIAAAFCGDASLVDESVVSDVMLELGNSAMGALRTAFLNDGFRFSGSLPKTVSFTDAATFLSEAEAKRVLTFRSDTAVLHVLVVVKRKPRVRILASMLREGMIPAMDIKNTSGVLLVAAGTRLTETACEKLRKFVPKVEVELADFN